MGSVVVSSMIVPDSVVLLRGIPDADYTHRYNGHFATVITTTLHGKYPLLVETLDGHRFACSYGEVTLTLDKAA